MWLGSGERKFSQLVRGFKLEAEGARWLAYFVAVEGGIRVDAPVFVNLMTHLLLQRDVLSDICRCLQTGLFRKLVAEACSQN